MLSVAEYIEKASDQGPPMPGIILGIRMCVLAMKLLEIDDPSRFHREVHSVGLTLCRACAGEAYWPPGKMVEQAATGMARPRPSCSPSPRVGRNAG